jgi:hypothetical protein
VETVQAVLRPGTAVGLPTTQVRYCATASCAVLYYAATGQVVDKTAALVRIGVKETEDPAPLCYCFGYSRADIRRQVAEGGESIPQRIAAEIKARGCSCKVKNPSGTCCLGEVEEAVRNAEAERR